MEIDIGKYCSFDDLPLSLTVAEVGEILRIGRSKIYQLVRCGEIRSIRIGRAIRVPRDAVAEYLRGA